MRQAAKTDANHAALMKDLRAVGICCHSLHAVGKGFPDLVCGFRGINVLLEIKDGSLPPSARKLTADEVKWQESWGGQVAVVNNSEQAIHIVLTHARMMEQK